MKNIIGIGVLLAAGCVSGGGQQCIADAECDPGDDCLGGACLTASAFSATPATARVTTSVGVAPAAASFTLNDSTKTGHPFSVACSGGAAALPASGKVSNTASAHISVQAPAPAQTGDATIVCTITSTKAKSAQATFALTVSVAQADDFAVSVSPASLSLAQGSSAQAGVQVAPVGSFNGAVALSVSGLPAGVSASFDATSVGTPGSATITFTADAGAAVGGATVQLSGSSGGIEHSAALALTVGASQGGIGPTGGTVDLLDFTFTGDTRPPQCGDTTAYPSALHKQIIQAMSAMHPQFGLDLGDHMYVCNNSASEAAQQMNLYVQGLAGFPSMYFMTMGNHECESSDCSGKTTDANYNAYLAALKSVSQQSSANYALHIATRLGRVTLVVVADDSFSAADQSWLDATLKDADASSKYTIISKHHPVTGTRTGPLAPWHIIQNHKFTLLLMAHNHDYEHSGANVPSSGRGVICGLGGANASHTGFCRVQQSADAQLHVTQYDIHGNPGDSFTVAPQ